MTMRKLAAALLLLPSGSLALPPAQDGQCDLGRDVTVVARLHDMPPVILADLERRAGEIAEPGEPFEPTDAYGPVHRPLRQFLRGFHIGRYWIIWYQHGGRGLHRHMLAYQIGVVGDLAHQLPAALPVANLYGDSCLATQAILNGIRGAEEF